MHVLRFYFVGKKYLHWGDKKTHITNAVGMPRRPLSNVILLFSSYFSFLIVSFLSFLIQEVYKRAKHFCGFVKEFADDVKDMINA